MQNQFRQHPRGFTLIELMVSMALTLFIMVILSQAFILALDTFSGLKGIGDMQQDLRTAATTLRSDLAAFHFDGARRVSDSDIATNPPRQGFFMVYQGKPSFRMATNVARDFLASPPVPAATLIAPNTYEGADPDGVHSYVATNHFLSFTSRLIGNGYGDFYRTWIGNAGFLNDDPLGLPSSTAADATLTPLGTNLFGSAWAELGYFLLQTGTTAEPDNPQSTLGTPLYGLYRAQYVVPTNTTGLNNNNNYPAGQAAFYIGVSHSPNARAGNLIDFLSPDDLANAQQPLYAANKVPTGGLRQTRSLALTNTKGFANEPAVPPSMKWTLSPTGGRTVAPIQVTNDPTGAVPPRNSLLMLGNVLSFHVQIMPKPDPAFSPYPYFCDPEPQPAGAHTPSADPTNLDLQTRTARLYDTGAYLDVTPAVAGGQPIITKITAQADANYPAPGRYLYGNYPYPVLAVQVTLRIWDTRSQQARQLTVVQDL